MFAVTFNISRSYHKDIIFQTLIYHGLNFMEDQQIIHKSPRLRLATLPSDRTSQKHKYSKPEPTIHSAGIVLRVLSNNIIMFILINSTFSRKDQKVIED